jgi:hypothetical protein
MVFLTLVLFYWVSATLSLLGQYKPCISIYSSWPLCDLARALVPYQPIFQFELLEFCQSLMIPIVK